jgi:hypothetical protein
VIAPSRHVPRARPMHQVRDLAALLRPGIFGGGTHMHRRWGVVLGASIVSVSTVDCTLTAPSDAELQGGQSSAASTDAAGDASSDSSAYQRSSDGAASSTCAHAGAPCSAPSDCCSGPCRNNDKCGG